MAKIFIVYGISQHGDAVEWPWLKCVEVFELNDSCRAEDRPKFGVKDTSPNPTDIVIELGVVEAEEHGLNPGFFTCSLLFDEAESRLNQKSRFEYP
jgi:hypothetical protein